MNSIGILHVVHCPKSGKKIVQEIKECYKCDHFQGLEYIENGFENVICNFGEKNHETNLD